MHREVFERRKLAADAEHLLDLAEKLVLGVWLGKDVRCADALRVLLGTLAVVAGDGQQDGCLLQRLAAADRANQLGGADFRDDRGEHDQARLGFEGLHRLLAVAGKGGGEWLPRERLLHAIGVARLVLDNKNVFRHVREGPSVFGNEAVILAQARRTCYRLRPPGCGVTGVSGFERARFSPETS